MTKIKTLISIKKNRDGTSVSRKQKSERGDDAHVQF